jgi:hypothetical protein
MLNRDAAAVGETGSTDASTPPLVCLLPPTPFAVPADAALAVTVVAVDDAVVVAVVADVVVPAASSDSAVVSFVFTSSASLPSEGASDTWNLLLLMLLLLLLLRAAAGRCVSEDNRVRCTRHSYTCQHDSLRAAGIAWPGIALHRTASQVPVQFIAKASECVHTPCRGSTRLIVDTFQLRTHVIFVTRLACRT